MSLTNSLQMLKCPYFTLKKCAIKNVNIEKDYCSVEYLRMFFFKGSTGSVINFQVQPPTGK